MSTFDHEDSPLSLQTRLLHDPKVDASGFRSVPMPIYRGSSTFFNNTAEQRAQVDALGLDYSYGLHGTPTQYELARQLSLIEGARHALVVPSGLSAIALIGLALLKSGDHWLIPNNAYAPTTSLAKAWKADFGIDYSVYDPLAPDLLAGHMTTNTKLLWMEAPGSNTFEVPDIAAIVATARNHGLTTAIDNTWSAGLCFKPFEHGIDISMQALTKYQSGHADVLMGSICSNNTALFTRIESRNRLLGLGVSPDDCSLVLRGLQTLSLRYEAQAQTALALAQWLETLPQIAQVLHPALPACPNHSLWKKYFTGCASIFSVILKSPLDDAAACTFVDHLKLFKIGYSWGGPESLALAMQLMPDRCGHLAASTVIRLAVGLESLSDLQNDITQSLSHL